MKRHRETLPVFGFAASSGTGKTTLAKKVIHDLCRRGLRVAVIKHAHHDFDVDVPGKDSYELRKAGAVQTLVSSSRRLALVTELAGSPEPSLSDLLSQLDPSRIDLVLVEGFKFEAIPKLEIRRSGHRSTPLASRDEDVIAIVTDDSALVSETEAAALPALDLNDTGTVAEFILSHFLGDRRVSVDVD